MQQWQADVRENSEMIQHQQQEFIRQGETIGQILSATGKIASLEGTLNKNLQALSGEKNFEDTVMSLSAAIHLLTTRLQDTQPDIELESKDKQGRAA